MSTDLADKLLCVSCNYPLTGLDRDANCPECGSPVRETAGVFAASGSLAYGIARLRDGYAACFALVMAMEPWVAAAVSIVAAGLVTWAAAILFFRAGFRQVPVMRARLYALGAASIVQAALPAALAAAGLGPVEVAYPATIACLVSAYIASGIGIRVARPIGYERIVHQLRSQRFIMYAMAVASILPIAVFGLKTVRFFIVWHLAILAVLGLIAIGHTVVALTELAKAVRLECQSDSGR